MAFQFGHKYSVGNNGGRPAIYDTEEELSSAIDDYFVYIQGEYEDKTKRVFNPATNEYEEQTDRVWIRYPEPATVTGMALFLGFESRQSLYDQSQRSDKFSYVIKRGKMRVENGYECNLTTAKSPAGSIFALKNMGWKDETGIDVTTQGNPLPALENMTFEQLYMMKYGKMPDYDGLGGTGAVQQEP
jgi:hypothetical protein